VAERVEVIRQLQIQRNGLGAQGQSGTRVLALGLESVRYEQLRGNIPRRWHMGYII